MGTIVTDGSAKFDFRGVSSSSLMIYRKKTMPHTGHCDIQDGGHSSRSKSNPRPGCKWRPVGLPTMRRIKTTKPRIKGKTRVATLRVLERLVI